ncbi:MAG: fibronectin type III domain-containing protein [Nostoc sp. S4]|nr:fibronectin type III domain-containing protein [Nostoc sp. S4]
MTVTPTSGTPDAPSSLAIKVFIPARTDSPLDLDYFIFTDTVDKKCHLEWRAPTSSRSGGLITSYLIESSANGSTGWSTVRNTGSTSTFAYNISKATGTVYFRVSAINASGIGTPSNVLKLHYLLQLVKVLWYVKMECGHSSPILEQFAIEVILI